MTTALAQQRFMAAGREAVAEEQREGRLHFLDNLSDLVEWAEEVGGCPEYRQHLRALLRAHEDRDEATLEAFVAQGIWPRAIPHIARGLAADYTDGRTQRVLQDRLLLTTREAAKRLSIDHSRLRSLIASGVLPTVRLGPAERVPLDALLDLVAGLERVAGSQPARGPKGGTNTSAQDNQGLMTPQEVSAFLGVPVGTLYSWRYLDKGPPAIFVGRHLRWRRADVDTWLNTAARRR